MSFPKYPEYKASGVEWLGEVPAHWEVLQLRRVIDQIQQGWSPECESRMADVGEWGVLKSGCVNGGRFNPFENKALPSHFDAPLGLEVAVGDLLMSRASGSPELVGAAALVVATPPRLLLSDKTFRLFVRKQTEKRFLAWLLTSRPLRAQIECAISGASGLANNLPQSSLVGFLAAFPSPSEQICVADYLDRETAKIDALVEEQQRLIELLKEKRQAVISQAVTKGLDPNVTLKDSGVEWLGKVPAHWIVVPAKRIAAIFVPQRNKPDLNSDGVGVFWATMDDMKDEKIAATSFSVSPEAAVVAGSRILKSDAVIAPCVGRFGMASINLTDLIINQQLQAFIPSPAIRAEFLRYFLTISGSYFEQIATAATITYVNQQGFESLPLTLPPVLEQEAIVVFLRASTAGIEQLIAEAEHARTLLQERRTALISAAVTGKIDVRGLSV